MPKYAQANLAKKASGNPPAKAKKREDDPLNMGQKIKQKRDYR